jgi:hypothetical protein
VPAVSVIDDADVPLLLALLIVSAVVAAPSVNAILRMAAVAAGIGGVAHALFGAARLLWRATRHARSAGPAEPAA